jgi:hypothetical protein
VRLLHATFIELGPIGDGLQAVPYVNRDS